MGIFASSDWSWTGDVASGVDDAFSKDGLMTGFTQDYIPGGGFVTAGFHARAGHSAHAEYAMVKGFSTTITTAASVAGGMAGGPVGAGYMGAMGAGLAYNWEQGMRSNLDPSVRGKIPEGSSEGMLVAMAAGGAGGVGGHYAGRTAKAGWSAHKASQAAKIVAAGGTVPASTGTSLTTHIGMEYGKKTLGGLASEGGGYGADQTGVPQMIGASGAAKSATSSWVPEDDVQYFQVGPRGRRTDFATYPPNPIDDGFSIIYPGQTLVPGTAMQISISPVQPFMVPLQPGEPDPFGYWVDDAQWDEFVSEDDGLVSRWDLESDGGSGEAPVLPGDYPTTDIVETDDGLVSPWELPEEPIDMPVIDDWAPEPSSDYSAPEVEPEFYDFTEDDGFTDMPPESDQGF